MPQNYHVATNIPTPTEPSWCGRFFTHESSPESCHYLNDWSFFSFIFNHVEFHSKALRWWPHRPTLQNPKKCRCPEDFSRAKVYLWTRYKHWVCWKPWITVSCVSCVSCEPDGFPKNLSPLCFAVASVKISWQNYYTPSRGCSYLLSAWKALLNSQLLACEKGDSNKEPTHRNGATGAGLPKSRWVEMVEGLGLDTKFHWQQKLWSDEIQALDWMLECNK